MLSQMQKQEEKEVAEDERGRKRAQKLEEKAEQVAESAQRRTARKVAPAPQEPTSSTRVRGRPKKSETKNDRQGKISAYLKKEEVEAKAGKQSVSEALQEAAEDEGKTAEVGIQDLKSARQPDLVTGGTMRNY